MRSGAAAPDAPVWLGQNRWAVAGEALPVCLERGEWAVADAALLSERSLLVS